jgi:hypothetical protein
VTPLDPGAKRKPALDESGFQQLLAAAYVLQQHNDSLRAQDPRLDTGWVLTQVAQTQSLLRAGGMDLDAATKLIADRLRTMTSSAGVSISLTTNGILKGVAESGVAARVPGNSLASHSLVATERLRNGRVFQSADAQKDIRLDIAACRQMGVRALLAIPIQGLGEVGGLIEVRWSNPDAVHESDVRTCQLMAALVTEVLEREHSSWVDTEGPQASPARPVSGFTANEDTDGKVPDADDPGVPPVEEPVSEGAAPISSSEVLTNSEAHSEALATPCRVCGRPFLANEAFCGNCSMPRVAGAPSEDLQSKWASLWYMQKAQNALEEREPSPELQAGMSYSEQQLSETPEWRDEPDEEQEQEARPQSVWRRPERVLDSARSHQEPASIPDLDDDAIAPHSWDDSIRAVWTRALQAVRLQMRRRDTAIVMTTSLALILLLVVWAWPTPASSHLTWFESVLVELGLAQVPSRTPAAPTGNPDVRVWVDVHTALYYCPGSDLYGKTPGGQFETQHNAQQDQFEPATGVVCE